MKREQEIFPYIAHLLNGAEVEWKPLGEVAEIINGYAFKSGKYSDNGLRVIRISDVQKGKISDNNLKYYSIEYIDKLGKALLFKDDLVMSLTGNVGRVAVLNENHLPAGLNQRVACIRSKSNIVLNRFLFHLFDQDSFEQEAMQNATGGGQKNMSTIWLSKYIIPVPPLSVQQEIVRILDKFTQLEAELEAELDCRKRQYEYYRNKLLSYEGNEVEWKTLDQISENLDFKRQPITSGLRTSGKIPYYGASGIVDYVEDYIFDGDFLLISEDGANLLARNTPIAFSVSGKIWVNNHAHILKFRTYEERRFIEFYLNKTDLTPYISGAAQPKLNKKNLNSIKIPIPPLEEQQRIVTILDKFDTLVNSINEGLPKEIALRRKQYEYYREKLLSFPKK